MGCDIHLYIEYKRKNRESWNGFGKRIYMGRIYGMFAKLADVRNGYGITPISEPRGVPDDIASEAFEDFTLYVSDDDSHDRFVKKERADQWVTDGLSKYIRDGLYVTNPDAHSGSWCTSSELEQAIEDVWKDGFNGSEIEWVAAVDLLKSLERQGCDTRVIFWFDN